MDIKQTLIQIILTLILLFYPFQVESYVAEEEEVIEIIIPEEIQEHPYKPYAYEVVLNKWNEGEWKAFENVIKNESGWHVLGNHKIELSSAYGLGGFLNGTWEGVGCKKSSDYKNQIECTARYIENRYETPTKALDFHRQNNWY